MFGQRKPAAPTPASNVGSYLSSVVKKMSSGGVDASAAAGVWHKVQGSIGVVHVVLGIILSVWALWVMSGLNAQVDALVLGAVLLVCTQRTVTRWTGFDTGPQLVYRIWLTSSGCARLLVACPLSCGDHELALHSPWCTVGTHRLWLDLARSISMEHTLWDLHGTSD